jgi:hypothetical protein
MHVIIKVRNSSIIESIDNKQTKTVQPLISQYPLLRFNTIQLIKNGSFTRTIWNYWRLYQEQPKFHGDYFQDLNQRKKYWSKRKKNKKKNYKRWFCSMQPLNPDQLKDIASVLKRNKQEILSRAGKVVSGMDEDGG